MLLRKHLISIGLSCTIAIVSSGLAYIVSPSLQFAEDYIYTLQSQLSGKIDDRILIVTIGDSTAKTIGTFPFQRSKYAEVIEKISKGKPAVIGIDIFFSGFKDTADDMRLLHVLDANQTKVVLAVDLKDIDNHILFMIKKTSRVSAFSGFNDVTLGDADIMCDFQGVMPRYISTIPFRHESGIELLPFSIEIASKYLKASYKQVPADNGALVAEIGSIKFPNRIGDNTPAPFLINYAGGLDAFDNILFEKIVSSSPAFFTNKIVLIGVTADSDEDHFKTPIGERTPGILNHANAIHTIINNRFIFEFSSLNRFLIVLIVCTGYSYVIFISAKMRKLAPNILIFIGFAFLMNFIFRNHSIYFPAVLFYAGLICTYCISVYSLRKL